MGRIFKTPSDNATEETLRAIHLANTVDTTYERTWGWVKTIIVCTKKYILLALAQEDIFYIK